MRQTLAVATLLCAFVMLSACSDDAPSSVDAGVDSGAPADAGGQVDAGSMHAGAADLGVDAALDQGIDAGADFGVDAFVVDLGVDASAIDLGNDASEFDAGAFAALGETCGGEDPSCAPGLACCYPCGIPGCMNTCATPCEPGSPGCGGGGCLLLP
ncbi:MAG: hypothetical protein IPK60_24165 [Sandaracinaceae bacterium]|nr:hypothetical protein [Sandaracinaceae bacterium]